MRRLGANTTGDDDLYGEVGEIFPESFSFLGVVGFGLDGLRDLLVEHRYAGRNKQRFF